MPSQDFIDQEKKHAEDKINSANAENAKKTVIFWTKAEVYIMGNFRKERRDLAGTIIEKEQELRSYNHVLPTSDPEMIEFIQNSDGFGIDIFEVPSMAVAQAKTDEQRMKKYATSNMQVSDQETTIIDTRPRDQRAMSGG